jgi:hypothetical protein
MLFLFLFVERAVPTLALYLLARRAALRAAGPLVLEARRVFARMGVGIGVIVAVWGLGATVSALNYFRFLNANAPARVVLLDFGHSVEVLLSGLVFSLRWIVFGAVVGYALLKYQVFDVELRTKRYAHAGTVVGGFALAAGLTGFVASEALPGNLGVLAAIEACTAARWKCTARTSRRRWRTGRSTPPNRPSWRTCGAAWASASRSIASSSTWCGSAAPAGTGWRRAAWCWTSTRW